MFPGLSPSMNIALTTAVIMSVSQNGQARAESHDITLIPRDTGTLATYGAPAPLPRAI